MSTSTRVSYVLAAIVLLMCLGASAENRTGNVTSKNCGTGMVTGPAGGYLPHRCYHPSPDFNPDRSYGPGKGYGRAKGYIPGKNHAVGEHYNRGTGFGPGRGFRLG